jgi:hypothetical protein
VDQPRNITCFSTGVRSRHFVAEKNLAVESVTSVKVIFLPIHLATESKTDQSDIISSLDTRRVDAESVDQALLCSKSYLKQSRTF